MVRYYLETNDIARLVRHLVYFGRVYAESGVKNIGVNDWKLSYCTAGVHKTGLLVGITFKLPLAIFSVYDVANKQTITNTG